MEFLSSDFRKDFKIANQYLQDKQFHTAIVFYHYALQQTQTNSAVYENLGDALYHTQQYQDAEAAYKSALALNPKLAYAHAQLGHIHFQQQRYAAAITAHREAISLVPTCIPFSQDLAQVLLAQNKSIEASKVYKRLGAVLRQAGLMTEAITAYQQAIALRPTPELHQAIGECYHLQGNLSSAIHHYQQVAQSDQAPQHLWFYKNWGEALLALASAPATN